jgi:hypothetical protein
MNIDHKPIFDIYAVEQLYSKKDGVDIKYVCTSAPNEHAAYAADIFYRETPHPDFGNRYFGLYSWRTLVTGKNTIMIANCDKIEDLDFGMIEGPNGWWGYSQHRHDYRIIGESSINGGRSYVRRSGDMTTRFRTMSVIDGKFEEVL